MKTLVTFASIRNPPGRHPIGTTAGKYNERSIPATSPAIGPDGGHGLNWLMSSIVDVEESWGTMSAPQHRKICFELRTGLGMRIWISAPQVLQRSLWPGSNGSGRSVDDPGVMADFLPLFHVQMNIIADRRDHLPATARVVLVRRLARAWDNDLDLRPARLALQSLAGRVLHSIASVNRLDLSGHRASSSCSS
jgi:hypothetical protein